MRTVTIRLPEELIEKAREKAAQEGTTLSQKVRWFVKQWIAKDEETNDETQTIPYDKAE